MRPLVTLTTDFGLDDGYVGTVKGVILGISPEANVVDISHGVEPQNLVQAAFVVGTSYRFFPRHAIHVVVVDPGVGSGRRAIVVDAPGGKFVAPDNGVLSWAIRDQIGRGRRLPSVGTFDLRGTRIRAFSLTNPKYWLPSVGRTFHARDVFGPVAAHLTRGVPFEELGEPIDEIVVLPLPHPRRRPDGAIVGHIVYVDRFGNLITDLAPDVVEKLPGEPIFEILGRTIVGLSRYYAERAGLIALVGSSGLIEIAVSGGSAARELRTSKGDVVVVRSTF